MIERGSVPFNWASDILRREIENGTFGSVTFIMQDGLIVTAKVEKSEKPPQREAPLVMRNGTR